MANIFKINTIGPLIVTQAFLPLLSMQEPQPPAVVVNVSSNLASIADNRSGGSTAYRCSKAALNMLTKTFAVDCPEVTFLSLHPGWVQTDMGSRYGRKPPLSVADSVAGLIEVISKCSPQQSGSFIDYRGSPLTY